MNARIFYRDVELLTVFLQSFY